MKKLAVVVLLVAAALVVLKKSDVQCIPKDTPEAQIQRLKDQLASTDNELLKFINQIAVREVEVKHLEEEVNKIRKLQADNKEVILAKREELKSDAAFVKADSKARQAAEKELSRLFHAYKRCEEELSAKEQKLDALKDALAASLDEMLAYKAQREEQEIELARLEAALAQVRVEEIKGKVHFDKSQLAEIQKQTDELRKQIEVRKTEQELQGRYLGKSAPAPEADKDVLSEIDALFGEAK